MTKPNKTEEEQGKPTEKKAEAEKLAKRDEDRKQALDYIEKAVKALDTPRTDDAAMPEALRESQLLLAEIYKEGEDFKKAASLYKPLIDDILKDSNKPFDETALRIFDGAGQAYLQSGDSENARRRRHQIHGVGARPGTGQPARS